MACAVSSSAFSRRIALSLRANWPTVLEVLLKRLANREGLPSLVEDADAVELRFPGWLNNRTGADLRSDAPRSTLRRSDAPRSPPRRSNAHHWPSRQK